MVIVAFCSRNQLMVENLQVILYIQMKLKRETLFASLFDTLYSQNTGFPLPILVQYKHRTTHDKQFGSVLTTRLIGRITSHQ